MRVLIDARPAVDTRRTGVGVYTRSMIEHLPNVDPGTRFVAWYLDLRSLGSRADRFARIAPNLTERATRLPIKGFQRVNARIGSPKVERFAGDADVVFATTYVPPPTSIECVVMVVHDLAFDLMPETAPHVTTRWRRSFDRWLAGAAAVIVPTEATRADLLRLHEVDASRVHAIHHGVDAEPFTRVRPADVDEVRRRFGIDGPYLLSLSGLEERKNLRGLVRAFERMSEDGVRLVIAGGPVRWAPAHSNDLEHEIARLVASARNRVVRTGYVSDADRRALLLGAEALVYPSRYEGFGFPVLEGFAARVPVLTSNVSSLPEVAGDGALLVDPHDVDAIAGGLDRIVGDEALREELRAAGSARIASFTWERSARRTAAVLHDAAERGDYPRPAANR
jgi:glycosyltransferase involved in cell wall biosynthesis